MQLPPDKHMIDSALHPENTETCIAKIFEKTFLKSHKTSLKKNVLPVHPPKTDWQFSGVFNHTKKKTLFEYTDV